MTRFPMTADSLTILAGMRGTQSLSDKLRRLRILSARLKVHLFVTVCTIFGIDSTGARIRPATDFRALSGSLPGRPCQSSRIGRRIQRRIRLEN